MENVLRGMTRRRRHFVKCTEVEAAAAVPPLREGISSRASLPGELVTVVATKPVEQP